MRILMLTQWFDPEPSFKGLLFAKALQGRGHSVQVLTGFPNYPGGKVYPGYRIRPWQREVMDGIPVLRVALFPSHSRSKLGRILNYLSFALSASVLGPLLVKQADVVYVYHPPATIGLPAMVLKCIRRMPFVYDVQDLWPDTLATTGMVPYGVILRIVGWYCQHIYRTAARIVVLSPGFKTALMQRGVADSKVSIIPNWCHPASGQQSEDLASGCFVVLFAGNMGLAQGLDTVLDAARELIARRPTIRFAFVGSGLDEDRLRLRANTEGLSNVLFLGRRPASQMGPLLARADALLVHLIDNPLFRITIPSKTQAYLAAGKPLLMGALGDAANIVQAAGAGLCFQPGNASRLAWAVETMYDMPALERQEMGAAGQRYYEKKLSLPVGVGRFELEFEAALQT